MALTEEQIKLMIQSFVINVENQTFHRDTMFDKIAYREKLKKHRHFELDDYCKRALFC